MGSFSFGSRKGLELKETVNAIAEWLSQCVEASWKKTRCFEHFMIVLLIDQSICLQNTVRQLVRIHTLVFHLGCSSFSLQKCCHDLLRVYNLPGNFVIDWVGKP